MVETHAQIIDKSTFVIRVKEEPQKNTEVVRMYGEIAADGSLDKTHELQTSKMLPSDSALEANQKFLDRTSKFKQKFEYCKIVLPAIVSILAVTLPLVWVGFQNLQGKLSELQQIQKDLTQDLGDFERHFQQVKEDLKAVTDNTELLGNLDTQSLLREVRSVNVSLSEISQNAEDVKRYLSDVGVHRTRIICNGESIATPTKRNQAILSPNKMFELRFQLDHNIVIYQKDWSGPGKDLPIWHSATYLNRKSITMRFGKVDWGRGTSTIEVVDTNTDPVEVLEEWQIPGNCLYLTDYGMLLGESGKSCIKRNSSSPLEC